MIDLFRFFGRAVCHQLPQRSLYIGAYGVLPVCARCAGIYTGVFVAFIYLLVKGRLIGNKPVSFFCAIMSVLSFLPLMVDGATSYLGLRDSNNALRLFTGLLCGYPLPVFFALLTNYAIDGNNNNNIIRTNGEFVHLLLLTLAVGLCINTATGVGVGVLLGMVCGFVISAGILILFFSVIHMLLCQLPNVIPPGVTVGISLFVSIAAVGAASVISGILRGFVL